MKDKISLGLLNIGVTPQEIVNCYLEDLVKLYKNIDSKLSENNLNYVLLQLGKMEEPLRQLSILLKNDKTNELTSLITRNIKDSEVS